MGLEVYYGNFGWYGAQRQPKALRFASDDFRDEVLMFKPRD